MHQRKRQFNEAFWQRHENKQRELEKINDRRLRIVQIEEQLFDLAERAKAREAKEELRRIRLADAAAKAAKETAVVTRIPRAGPNSPRPAPASPRLLAGSSKLADQASTTDPTVSEAALAVIKAASASSAEHKRAHLAQVKEANPQLSLEACEIGTLDSIIGPEPDTKVTLRARCDYG